MMWVRRLFLIVIFCSGLGLAAGNEAGLWAPLQEVYRLIHQYYYRAADLSDQELVYGALKGMVRALGDPYSTFFTPEEYEKWNQEVSGEYYGVGMEITIKDGRVTVVTPFPGTPAYKAGIKPGDWIKEVDGVPTEGMSLEEVSSRIRGPEGTQVTLTVQHPDGTVEKVTLTRAKIHLQPVMSEYWADKKVAYIRIILFTPDAPAAVGRALYHLPLEELRGVVLDLRNNPGGYLSAAVDVASFFIDSGPVLYSRGPSYGQEVYYSHGNAFPNVPVAVLVNRGTASAAEIVAGAIRDHGVGVLVGRKTFGKGVIQRIVRVFPDGSALKLTTGEYLTPAKHAVQGVGLEPDIPVEDEDEDVDAAVQWILSQSKSLVRNP